MKGRSPRRRTSAPVRVFTLEEANAILPEVRGHAQSMRVAIHEIARLQDSADVLEMIGAGRAESPEHAELRGVRSRLAGVVRDYEERLESFQQLGCLMKNVESGLVDFYSHHDGRLVFLCWKLGEEQVSHWHEIRTGFPGRRPVR